jgi:TonB family protein
MLKFAMSRPLVGRITILMPLNLDTLVQSGIRSVFGLLVVFGLRAAEAQGSGTALPSSSPSVVASDVYQPPRRTQQSLPAYPPDEELLGIEGWVVVSAMVDPNGKPYEAAVVDSTGQKAFETLALKSLESWTLFPAELNGRPIDSVYRYKFTFVLPGHPMGAREEFVIAYRKVTDALKHKDRAAADAELTKLNVHNLYEDAFKGLAEYSYAVQYGNADQQIAGLYRAIANESEARYLPRDTFEFALTNLLRLQLKMSLFSEALDTWAKLQKVVGDKKTLATFEPIIAQVEILRSDDRPYIVSGDLKDGGWFIQLFKSNFRIAVISGQISTLKLRCERSYRTFEFDPELEYHVPKQAGLCHLEIDGSSGSKFKLVQA